MSDLLSVGKSAIRAYSYALSTTSQNIANSQTPGYVRRSPLLAEAPSASDMALYQNALSSSGVTIEGVARKVEQWLVADARDSSSNAEQASALSAWLGAAEASLSDDEFGIGDTMGNVFDKADRLSADANDHTRRSEFLSAIQQSAERISTAANRMTSIKTGISDQATQAIDSIETQLHSLKEINFALQRARVGSGNTAGLLDNRDRLLSGISEHLAIEVETGFNGTLTVRAAGPGGPVLLDDSGAASLSMSEAANGQLEFTVTKGGTTSALTPAAGSLAGLSAASRIITTRQGELDALADDFATLINDFQADGLDSYGNAGTDILDSSGGAAGLSMVHMDAKLVAAADATAINGNMLSFGSKRDNNAADTRWEAIATSHTQATAAARQQEAITGTMRDNALLARDESGAVDLDEEAANLMRYQQAYQGAARILQVAREIMQTIFNSL